MWQNILDLAIKNGLWAVLFLGLLIFVLKDSTKREKKYQDTISDLTEHLKVVHEIKKEVEEVKDVVFTKKTSKKKQQSEEKNEKQI
ncbi:MAG: hypothetical protein KBT30_02825 [Clostridiales bacterium]|nr:hypothetical protein [Candidatus Apopatousia equi]